MAEIVFSNVRVIDGAGAASPGEVRVHGNAATVWYRSSHGCSSNQPDGQLCPVLCDVWPIASGSVVQLSVPAGAASTKMRYCKSPVQAWRRYRPAVLPMSALRPRKCGHPSSLVFARRRSAGWRGRAGR